MYVEAELWSKAITDFDRISIRKLSVTVCYVIYVEFNMLSSFLCRDLS